ncbi:MAG: DUF362 domain-containing protein [Spirochaetaceae bacterium]
MSGENTSVTGTRYNVGISRCTGYNREKTAAAVEEAVHRAGGLDIEGKRVLLKPNILRDADPGRAITTHPEILRSVIRVCSARGASEILVGDSPGFAPGGFSGRKSFLRQVVEDEGARWVDFHSEKTVREVPDPLRERVFHVTSVLDSVDAVISLPKLKTHTLMYYTGAVKNLFGLIPGLAKPPFHVRYPGREEFGEMLIDLAEAVKPHYAIMDGIVAMEGAGPGNGTPRATGVVAASPSCLALDIALCRIIGYDPLTVPTNRIGLAKERNREEGLKSAEDIRLVGASLEELRIENFELIGKGEFSRFWRVVTRNPLLRKVEVKLRKKPVFNHEKCIHCGECVNICAAGALSMIKVEGKRRIRVDYSRCIRCYCCHEICPADAIRIGRSR